MFHPPIFKAISYQKAINISKPKGRKSQYKHKVYNYGFFKIMFFFNIEFRTILNK